VGTQAVLNVLCGERYQTIAKETAGVLRGEYGATPASVDPELQRRVLKPGEEPLTCRPADLLAPELDKLSAELRALAGEKGLRLADEPLDDVLTYALFPQVGLRFLQHRDDPSAFEPPPWAEPAVPETVPPPVPAVSAEPAAVALGPESYLVVVDGKRYSVSVSPQGAVESIAPEPAAASPSAVTGTPVPAPLAGTVFKVTVRQGQAVAVGDVILILEAMKMETEVRSNAAGKVAEIRVREGDAVRPGDCLLLLA
jgi:oxaloacetate decarboxylase alpha subunit